MAFPWTEVAAVATTAGATAAWRSASASRQAVARANRPFVWPEWTMDMDAKQWRVRLHNDGPGVALDVRWSIQFDYYVDPTDDDHKRGEMTTRALASEPIRGMKPGASVPPVESEQWSERHFPHEVPVADLWWLVVRFTDSAGMRWEYAEPWDVATLAEPVRRLQKVRSYRSHPRWWLWRLRPRRPLRAWTAVGRPGDW